MLSFWWNHIIETEESQVQSILISYILDLHGHHHDPGDGNGVGSAV